MPTIRLPSPPPPKPESRNSKYDEENFIVMQKMVESARRFDVNGNVESRNNTLDSLILFCEKLKNNS